MHSLLNSDKPDVSDTSRLGHSGNVLLIAPQPFYQDRGTPIAEKYVLEALTQLGYTVDLITYPLGSTPVIDGVRYFRVPNLLGFKSIPVSFSWRKVFLDILIGVRMIRLLRREKYVYIHAVEEAAILAAGLRRFHKTRVVYDMASSMPEQLASTWPFKYAPIMRVSESLESWLLRSVDLVVASAGLKEKLGEIAPDAKVVDWYFPSVRVDVPDAELRGLRHQLGIGKDEKTVVYAGTFEFYQGIDSLIDAVPEIVRQSPNAVLILIGAKSDKEIDSIRQRIDKTYLNRVRILSRVPKDQVNRYLALADVLVSPRKVGLNVPLKIFDYLRAAKPIVVTDIAAHRAIVDESLAEIVSPNAESIANGIARVVNDAERAEGLARSAAAFADEKLSWGAFLKLVASLARV